MRHWSCVIAIVALLSLVGCGGTGGAGGGDPGGDEPAPVPDDWDAMTWDQGRWQ